MAGELLVDLGGQHWRLGPGDFTLMNVGVRHALGNAGSEPARWLSLNSPRKQDPESGRVGHVLRAGPGPGRDGRGRPPAAVRRSDPAPRRALPGHAAPARGPGRRRSGARARAGRHGHRDPGLQRDQREDARRPRLRRGPRDDVHGRLRGGRRRPGARPPVRGGVRLPRGRDRGRARRRAPHAPRGRRRVRAGRARSTASTTRARAASAGSRPRHRNRRPGTPTAGGPPGSATRRRRRRRP